MSEVDISERLLSTLWQQLLDNAVSLPTLPDLATRLDALAQRAAADARHLADEIRKDPGIAAQVVRIANSAAYRGGAPVSQLQAAVTRIGVDSTRHLVRGLALRQLFSSPSVVLQSRLRAIWSRSLEVAACAQLLARHGGRLEAETGLLAGLVHQIGALPLLRLLERYPELLQSPAAVDDVLRRLGGRAGELVLSSWAFPTTLLAVPAQCMNFTRIHRGEADYVDLVCVAVLALDRHYEGPHAGVDRSRIEAFAKLGVDPAEDPFERPGFADQYRELLAALTS